MAEDRRLTRLRQVHQKGQVWITSEEYEEWNVSSSPDWIVADRDMASDMVLIARVSSNDSEVGK